MKNIANLVIEVVAVAAGAASTCLVISHVIKKRQEDRYFTTEEAGSKAESETKQDDQSLKDRITEAATEKALDILSWAGNHEKEMKGIALMLTVAGGAIDVALGLKKVFKRSKLFEEVHNLNTKVWNMGYDAGWQASSDDVFKTLNECVKTGRTFKFTDVIHGEKVTIGEWIIKGMQEATA